MGNLRPGARMWPIEMSNPDQLTLVGTLVLLSVLKMKRFKKKSGAAAFSSVK